MSGGICPGDKCSGDKCPMGKCPGVGGLCPV